MQIFVIGFVNELDAEKGLIRKSPRDKAVTLLNKLASDTGGRAFFPQSISELPQIANEIVRDLRTQYVISYDPTNKAHDGTYRSIKVSVAQTGAEKESRSPVTDETQVCQVPPSRPRRRLLRPITTRGNPQTTPRASLP